MRSRSDYLAYWPKNQPFPYSIARSRAMVPNRQSVDWPQSQFAPLFLPPGSPSFQPYSYFKNDVPLASQQPHYTIANFGPVRSPYAYSLEGPGGDTSRLPLSYGALMNPSLPLGVHVKTAGTGRTPSAGFHKARAVQTARLIKILRKRRRTRSRRRLMRVLLKKYKMHKRLAKLGAQGKPVSNRVKQYRLRQAVLHEEATGTVPAPSLAPPMKATRWGLRSTGIPIRPGIPHAPAVSKPLPAMATAGLRPIGGSATGLAGVYGDVDLGGDDCGCGCGGAGDCANNNPMEPGAATTGLLTMVAVGGLALWGLTMLAPVQA